MKIHTEIEDPSAIEALKRVRDRANGSVRRGLLKAGLFVGRKVSENVIGFMETPGTRRLARSFLTPEAEGNQAVVLGRGAPIYAAIHEYGGIIKPRKAKTLAFEIDGEMVFASQVKIREKRYARRAIDQTGDRAAELLGLEIANDFSGGAS